MAPRTAQRNRFLANSLLLHLRPAWVPERATRFTHTFGLGGMAMVLVLLLLASGLLMSFVYDPAPERAYASIVILQQDLLFGRLIRGMHYWSANLLVVVAGLHLLRVFLTGAFHGPRSSNWLIGLGLLFDQSPAEAMGDDVAPLEGAVAVDVVPVVVGQPDLRELEAILIDRP